MATIHCPCGKTSEYNIVRGHAWNPADVEAKTGFRYIILENGHSWLCGDCHQKALALAAELVKVAGHDDFYFRGFLK